MKFEPTDDKATDEDIKRAVEFHTGVKASDVEIIIPEHWTESTLFWKSGNRQGYWCVDGGEILVDESEDLDPTYIAGRIKTQMAAIEGFLEEGTTESVREALDLIDGLKELAENLQEALIFSCAALSQPSDDAMIVVHEEGQ